jgi:hypothetical protein
VDITYHYPTIFGLTTKVAYDLAHKGAVSAKHRAQRMAPKRTGALAASITVEMRGIVGPVVTFVISSPLDYAAYQEFGTGPIVPKRAKALSFTVGGMRVFAMRTSGVPATHFMQRAGLLVTAKDFT